MSDELISRQVAIEALGHQSFAEPMTEWRSGFNDGLERAELIISRLSALRAAQPLTAETKDKQ